MKGREKGHTERNAEESKKSKKKLDKLKEKTHEGKNIMKQNEKIKYSLSKTPLHLSLGCNWTLMQPRTVSTIQPGHRQAPYSFPCSRRYSDPGITLVLRSRGCGGDCGMSQWRGSGRRKRGEEGRESWRESRMRERKGRISMGKGDIDLMR